MSDVFKGCSLPGIIFLAFFVIFYPYAWVKAFECGLDLFWWAFPVFTI
jgi:hypothetical protein